MCGDKKGHLEEEGEEKQIKTLVHMLCYNSEEMIRGALENFRDTVDEDPSIVKVMFEVQYPLPSKEESYAYVKRLSEEYGWGFHSIPNRGVAGNWTQAFDYFDPGDDDVIVGFDPDCRMRPKGWLKAITEVNAAHPEAPCVIPNRTYKDEPWCVQQHGRQIVTDPKTGYRLGYYRELISWSLGSHRCDWLKMLRQYGPFGSYNPQYGFSEHWQYDQLRKYGKRWVELSDFYDDHVSADALYTKWKSESAENKTQLKFDEWLALQTPQDK